MFGSFQWSSLLSYVALVTVILTVVVGVLGLRQGYYRSGKLTRRGRHMVTWLIALGIASLVSGTIDRHITEAKDKSDADTRERQFSRQMASLQTMTENLGGVQHTLNDSLSRQERLTRDLRAVQTVLNSSIQRQESLAALTAENLRVGRRLQAQADANTNNLIRRISDDTNRIRLNQIEASAAIFCSNREQLGSRAPQAYAFEIVLGDERMEQWLYTRRRERSLVSTNFHGFEGRLGRYDTFERWRNTRISIRLSAGTRARIQFDESGDVAALEAESLSQAPRVVIDCNVYLYVFINGRAAIMTGARLRDIGASKYEAVVNDAQVVPDESPDST